MNVDKILGNVKTGFNLGAHIFCSDYAVMTELTPKWNPCRPLYFVTISTLLVTLHTDLGQSSFDIDYLRIIMKDVNVGKNSITRGNPALKLTTYNCNTESASLG